MAVFQCFFSLFQASLVSVPVSHVSVPAGPSADIQGDTYTGVPNFYSEKDSSVAKQTKGEFSAPVSLSVLRLFFLANKYLIAPTVVARLLTLERLNTAAALEEVQNDGNTAGGFYY